MTKPFKKNERAQLALRHSLELVKKYKYLSNEYADKITGLESIESKEFDRYFFNMVRLVEHKLNVIHEIKQLELTLHRPARDFSVESDQVVRTLRQLRELAKYKINLRLTNKSLKLTNNH